MNTFLQLDKIVRKKGMSLDIIHECFNCEINYYITVINETLEVNQNVCFSNVFFGIVLKLIKIV